MLNKFWPRRFPKGLILGLELIELAKVVEKFPLLAGLVDGDTARIKIFSHVGIRIFRPIGKFLRLGYKRKNF